VGLTGFNRRAIFHTIARLAILLALTVFLPSRTGLAQDSSSPDEQSSGTVLSGGISNDDSGGGGDVFSTNGSSGGDEFNSNAGGGGDEFNSNGGGGGDEFNSNGGGGGDEFNSNGGGGGPYAYPTPPPRFPCGPNALENQAWGGAFASGFLGMLRPLVERACPYNIAPRRRPSGPPVFVYYYINGMNTPVSRIYDPNNPDYWGNWRGSCITEHDTFAQNVLGKTVSSPDIPRPTGAGAFVSIKVANETDVMYPPTCNVSGKDPWGGNWYTRNCTGSNVNNAWLAKLLCAFLDPPNGFRGGQLFGGSISPTDLFECIRQSNLYNIPIVGPDPLNLPLWRAYTIRPGIDYTTNQEVVVKIVNSIRAIYAKELQSGSTQRHYFIVVGHSQGNFFVEGVAYKLYKSDALGQQIFWNRLGIISLGSPTSYNSLPPNWIAAKLKHRTRTDDGINVLLVANVLLQSVLHTQLFKIPWPMGGDDSPLWNWRTDPRITFFGASNFDQAKKLIGLDFALMGATPPQGPSLWSLQNPELYEPLLNSHLVDNYLSDPTATKQGVPISDDLYKYLYRVTSPSSPPLLGTIKSDLVLLKTSLLNQPGTLQAKGP
jgi:hypothetical protein